MNWEKNTNVKIIKKDDNLMAKIYNYFFSHHNNLYVINDDNNKIGLITYNSFLNNISNLDKMLNYDIAIIHSEDELDENCFSKEQILVMDKDNKIIGEYYKKPINSLDIDFNRWDYLYKDNDKVIDYLKSLNLTKVIILGSLKEKVCNYIKKYGSNIRVLDNIDTLEDYLKISKEDVLIIDTDNNLVEFKKKLVKTNNVISLNELCNYSEYFYFVNTLSKNIPLHVFTFPDIQELEYLTEEEKLRIAFDHHYRYYYERYKENKEIKKLLETVLGDLFSDEFIDSRNYMPNIILRNGRIFLEDSHNPYCSSYNGLRRTTNQMGNKAFNLNVFGPCMVFGALVDDDNTIPSLMQNKINLLNYDYKVNNYGARAIDFAENIRTIGGITVNNHDQFVFIINSKEQRILESMGYRDAISLLPVLNNPELKNYFIDEPIHCNKEANNLISDFIIQKIEKDLLKVFSLNKELVKPIMVPNPQNVFKNNKYLQEYLTFLDSYSSFKGHAGSIIMNCNPFTYGHFKLIEYVSSLVDRLYVFVVQEDKSLFKFEDRFDMVMKGCANFNNVLVLPSGKILASAMLFPEYFTKDDNPDVSIDASLDNELFAQYIAPKLNITKRFVGEENVDKITRAYNIELKENLPSYGIEVIEIPRFKDEEGIEISAKNVRMAMQEGDITKLEKLVPSETLKVIEEKYMLDKNKRKIKKRGC